MARKRRRRSRRHNALALFGGRRKRRSSRRRRNALGLFKRRGRHKMGLRVRMHRGRGGKYRKRGRRRVTLFSHPGRKLASLRRRFGRRYGSRRRRNPNGFLGEILKGGIWVEAGGIAIGAVGATVLVQPLWAKFAPEALRTGMAATIARPLATAAVGALLGWGVSMLPMRNASQFGRRVALGGVVAAAIDVVTAVGKQAGLISGYGDYIQLQGLGGQAQVEAGEFGDYVQLEGQAQVEAGELGHTAEETAAANTFGPTF